MFIIKSTENDSVHIYNTVLPQEMKMKTGINIHPSQVQYENNFHYFDFLDHNLSQMNSFYIRFVIVNSSTPVYLHLPGHSIKGNRILSSNKIIVSDKYYLYNPKTITKFNLEVTSKYIDMACYNGCVSFLTWWKNSGLPLHYSQTAIYFATQQGHINVLEWWKNSGLSLKYTESSMNLASEFGKVDILEWWKNSGLELKYTYYAINYASYRGYITTLEWWKNSGLPLKYTENAINWASEHGQVAVLEWWKNSGLELKYNGAALEYASMYGQIAVLEWWSNSGLELKYYSLEPIRNNYCNINGDLIQKWWEKNISNKID